MPLTEGYIPHDDNVAAKLCQLLGHDPGQYGAAGWIVILCQPRADGSDGMDVCVSTDAPTTEALLSVLGKVVETTEGAGVARAEDIMASDPAAVAQFQARTDDLRARGFATEAAARDHFLRALRAEQ